jgi:hypothetical protein
MLKSNGTVNTATNLPKNVGEARGKIHIISRYKDSTIGTPAYEGWQDSTSFTLGDIYVQDNYRVNDPDIKISDIDKTIAVAEGLEYSLVLNFTSCYYPDGFPPTYAGTPAHVINPWLIDRLQDTSANGVFLCDFITDELCKIIIRGNFK